MQKYFRFFIIAALLFSFGCQKQDKNNLIDKKTFGALIAEMMTIQYLKIDKEEKTLLVKNLFSKYGVTKGMFIKTRDYYSKDPVYWEKIFKIVKQKLNEETVKERRKTANRPLKEALKKYPDK
ncbi:MAG: DUF4296 domain-containing protein [Calditrichaeota bacterium]|nr:DUF4296 domain-containing protein [Calditrichota bacterium]